MDGIFVPLALLAAIGFKLLRHFQRMDSHFIRAPSIGFVDLSGGEFAALLDEDRATLAPLFAATRQGGSTPPRCDVLFLYLRIGEDGRIGGSARRLPDLIREAEATIAVVANEHSGRQYNLAAQQRGFGYANLVMTLHRKGPAFAQFFQQLFTLMHQGESMPAAWLMLAPQIPGRRQPDCPDTIFVCEAGPVSFR